jgi:hypothetical protein
VSIVARGLGSPAAIIVTSGLGRVLVALVYEAILVEGTLPVRGPAITGELAALASVQRIAPLRGPSIAASLAAIVGDDETVIVGVLAARPAVTLELSASAAAVTIAVRALGPVIVGALRVEDVPVQATPVVLGELAARAPSVTVVTVAVPVTVGAALQLRGPATSAALILNVAA